MSDTAALAVSREEASVHGGDALFTIFGLEVSSVIVTMWILMAVIIIISFIATRHMERVPCSRLQNAVEYVVEAILNFLTQIMGDEKLAREYLPLLGSFFILILASNYSGLLPGAGHIPGLQAPTSTLSVTAAFALIVFFATHISGVRRKGLKYFKHFIEPYVFMLPLNIIEELVRPLSLSLRLFGNIFGEEMVVAGLLSLLPLFVPVPMMILGVLFGLVQAYVFTMLAAIYISAAVAEHH